MIGMCFGHQIIARAFGGTVEFCKSRRIGLNDISLNSDGLNNDIFKELGKHFLTLCSHRQFVSKLSEGKSLGDNNHTPNQIIQIGENIIGTQFHPEFSPEFTSFLIKLMSSDLVKEGLNPEKLIKNMEQLNRVNPTKVVIENFVKKHFI